METVAQLLFSACISALFGMVALISQTWHNYSRTGPGIPKEIERKFRWYMVYAGLRLSLWCYLIFLLTALPGPLIWQICTHFLNIEFKTVTAVFFGLCSSTFVVSYFFAANYYFLPARFNYRFNIVFPGYMDYMTH